MAARLAACTAVPVAYPMFILVVIASAVARPLGSPSSATAASATAIPAIAAAAAAASTPAASIAAAEVAAAAAAATLRGRSASLPAAATSLASARAEEVDELVDIESAWHWPRQPRAARRLLGRVMAAKERGG